MSPRAHRTTAPTRTASTGTARSSRAHLVLVVGGDVDERGGAARAASMARHPAGSRATVVSEQRAASIARHPAGGAGLQR